MFPGCKWHIPTSVRRWVAPCGLQGGQVARYRSDDDVSKPLSDYLQATRDSERVYVFPSQRSERLTEEGIHYWFRTLKAQATWNNGNIFTTSHFTTCDMTLPTGREQLVRSLEEVAYYLGHVTKKGLPAIQTTVRYTQVSREQVKEKLRAIKG